MNHKAKHNHDREFIELDEIDPVTFRRKVQAVQKILQPGMVYDLPDDLAQELLRKPFGGGSGRPAAEMATEDEATLWRNANPTPRGDVA
jgi:hypothetical protein